MKNTTLHNISKEEIKTIQDGISLQSRIDGRSLHQKRKIQIQEGNLPQASGSATSTLESTMVLVGIHANTISDNRESQWTLMVDPLNPSLYDLLSKLLHTIPWNLAHVQNKNVWHFYIDLLLLSEGSGIECCSWSAITAAIHSLKLPKVSIMEDETILLDETEATNTPFKDISFINLTTVSIFDISMNGNYQYCIDPTLEEIQGCSTVVHVGHSNFISLLYQSKTAYLSTNIIQDIQRLLL